MKRFFQKLRGSDTKDKDTKDASASSSASSSSAGSSTLAASSSTAAAVPSSNSDSSKVNAGSGGQRPTIPTSSDSSISNEQSPESTDELELECALASLKAERHALNLPAGSLWTQLKEVLTREWRASQEEQKKDEPSVIASNVDEESLLTLTRIPSSDLASPVQDSPTLAVLLKLLCTHLHRHLLLRVHFGRAGLLDELVPQARKVLAWPESVEEKEQQKWILETVQHLLPYSQGYTCLHALFNLFEAPRWSAAIVQTLRAMTDTNKPTLPTVLFDSPSAAEGAWLVVPSVASGKWSSCTHYTAMAWLRMDQARKPDPAAAAAAPPAGSNDLTSYNHPPFHVFILESDDGKSLVSLTYSPAIGSFALRTGMKNPTVLFAPQQPNQSIKKGTWFHVALTHSKSLLGSSMATLYLNGQPLGPPQKCSFPSKPNMNTTNVQVRIGLAAASDPANGVIQGSTPLSPPPATAALHWRLSSCAFLDDCLSEAALRMVYDLGPRLSGVAAGASLLAAKCAISDTAAAGYVPSNALNESLDEVGWIVQKALARQQAQLAAQAAAIAAAMNTPDSTRSAAAASPISTPSHSSHSQSHSTRPSPDPASDSLPGSAAYRFSAVESASVLPTSFLTAEKLVFFFTARNAIDREGQHVHGVVVHESHAHHHHHAHAQHHHPHHPSPDALHANATANKSTSSEPSHKRLASSISTVTSSSGSTGFLLPAHVGSLAHPAAVLTNGGLLGLKEGSSDALVLGRAHLLAPVAFSDAIRSVGGVNKLLALIAKAVSATTGNGGGPDPLAVREALLLLSGCLRRNPRNLREIRSAKGWRLLAHALQRLGENCVAALKGPTAATAASTTSNGTNSSPEKPTSNNLSRPGSKARSSISVHAGASPLLVNISLAIQQGNAAAQVLSDTTLVEICFSLCGLSDKGNNGSLAHIEPLSTLLLNFSIWSQFDLSVQTYLFEGVVNSIATNPSREENMHALREMKLIPWLLTLVADQKLPDEILIHAVSLLREFLMDPSPSTATAPSSAEEELQLVANFALTACMLHSQHEIHHQQQQQQLQEQQKRDAQAAQQQQQSTESTPPGPGPLQQQSSSSSTTSTGSNPAAAAAIPSRGPFNPSVRRFTVVGSSAGSGPSPASLGSAAPSVNVQAGLSALGVATGYLPTVSSGGSGSDAFERELSSYRLGSFLSSRVRKTFLELLLDVLSKLHASGGVGGFSASTSNLLADASSSSSAASAAAATAAQQQVSRTLEAFHRAVDFGWIFSVLYTLDQAVQHRQKRLLDLQKNGNGNGSGGVTASSSLEGESIVHAPGGPSAPTAVPNQPNLPKRSSLERSGSLTGLSDFSQSASPPISSTSVSSKIAELEEDEEVSCDRSCAVLALKLLLTSLSYPHLMKKFLAIHGFASLTQLLLPYAHMPEVHAIILCMALGKGVYDVPVIPVPSISSTSKQSGSSPNSSLLGGCGGGLGMDDWFSSLIPTDHAAWAAAASAAFANGGATSPPLLLSPTSSNSSAAQGGSSSQAIIIASPEAMQVLTALLEECCHILGEEHRLRVAAAIQSQERSTGSPLTLPGGGGHAMGGGQGVLMPSLSGSAHHHHVSPAHHHHSTSSGGAHGAKRPALHGGLSGAHSSTSPASSAVTSTGTSVHSIAHHQRHGSLSLTAAAMVAGLPVAVGKSPASSDSAEAASSTQSASVTNNAQQSNSASASPTPPSYHLDRSFWTAPRLPRSSKRRLLPGLAPSPILVSEMIRCLQALFEASEEFRVVAVKEPFCRAIARATFATACMQADTSSSSEPLPTPQQAIYLAPGSLTDPNAFVVLAAPTTSGPGMLDAPIIAPIMPVAPIVSPAAGSILRGGHHHSHSHGARSSSLSLSSRPPHASGVPKKSSSTRPPTPSEHTLDVGNRGGTRSAGASRPTTPQPSPLVSSTSEGEWSLMHRVVGEESTDLPLPQSFPPPLLAAGAFIPPVVANPAAKYEVFTNALSTGLFALLRQVATHSLLNPSPSNPLGHKVLEDLLDSVPNGLAQADSNTAQVGAAIQNASGASNGTLPPAHQHALALRHRFQSILLCSLFHRLSLAITPADLLGSSRACQGVIHTCKHLLSSRIPLGGLYTTLVPLVVDVLVGVLDSQEGRLALDLEAVSADASNASSMTREQSRMTMKRLSITAGAPVVPLRAGDAAVFSTASYKPEEFKAKQLLECTNQLVLHLFSFHSANLGSLPSAATIAGLASGNGSPVSTTLTMPALVVGTTSGLANSAASVPGPVTASPTVGGSAPAAVATLTSAQQSSLHELQRLSSWLLSRSRTMLGEFQNDLPFLACVALHMVAFMVSPQPAVATGQGPTTTSPSIAAVVSPIQSSLSSTSIRVWACLLKNKLGYMSELLRLAHGLAINPVTGVVGPEPSTSGNGGDSKDSKSAGHNPLLVPSNLAVGGGPLSPPRSPGTIVDLLDGGFDHLLGVSLAELAHPGEKHVGGHVSPPVKDGETQEGFTSIVATQLTGAPDEFSDFLHWHSTHQHKITLVLSRTAGAVFKHWLTESRKAVVTASQSSITITTLAQELKRHDGERIAVSNRLPQLEYALLNKLQHTCSDELQRNLRKQQRERVDQTRIDKEFFDETEREWMRTSMLYSSMDYAGTPSLEALEHGGESKHNNEFLLSPTLVFRQAWKLDRIEGPARVRKRLDALRIQNYNAPTFDYPYKPFENEKLAQERLRDAQLQAAQATAVAQREQDALLLASASVPMDSSSSTNVTISSAITSELTLVESPNFEPRASSSLSGSGSGGDEPSVSPVPLSMEHPHVHVTVGAEAELEDSALPTWSRTQSLASSGDATRPLPPGSIVGAFHTMPDSSSASSSSSATALTTSGAHRSTRSELPNVFSTPLRSTRRALGLVAASPHQSMLARLASSEYSSHGSKGFSQRHTRQIAGASFTPRINRATSLRSPPAGGGAGSNLSPPSTYRRSSLYEGLSSPPPPTSVTTPPSAIVEGGLKKLLLSRTVSSPDSESTTIVPARQHRLRHQSSSPPAGMVLLSPIAPSPRSADDMPSSSSGAHHSFTFGDLGAVSSGTGSGSQSHKFSFWDASSSSGVSSSIESGPLPPPVLPVAVGTVSPSFSPESELSSGSNPRTSASPGPVHEGDESELGQEDQPAGGNSRDLAKSPFQSVASTAVVHTVSQQQQQQHVDEDIDDADAGEDWSHPLEQWWQEEERLSTLLSDEQIRFHFNCLRIDGLDEIRGILLLCRDAMFLIDNYEISPSGEITPVLSDTELDRLEMEQQNLLASMHGGDSEHPPLPPPVPIEHHSEKLYYADLVDLQKRRYLLREAAIELFLQNGTNAMIVFNVAQRDTIYTQILSASPLVKTQQNALSKILAAGASAVSSVSGGGASSTLSSSGGTVSSSFLHSSVPTSKSHTPEFAQDVRQLLHPLTKLWQMGQLSNLEYLQALNLRSGRTYNDLTQYPVLPWILCDYGSEELDLNDLSVYRDLTKPMGALDEKRAASFRQKYRDSESVMLDLPSSPNRMDGEDGEENDEPRQRIIPKYNFSTHYSSPAIVLWYLLRLEPYTQTLIKFQSGRFDRPDRLFHSIAYAYLSASKLSTNDVKELIPEFFFLDSFLLNRNKLNLGTRQDDLLQKGVDDVFLPRWSHGNAKEFIRLHRRALESEYVSAHLHSWIDLIFGVKQQGEAAVHALNVFYYLTYAGGVDIDSITDPILRRSSIEQIRSFGQTPLSLFSKPHPPKHLMHDVGSVYNRAEALRPSMTLHFTHPVGSIWTDVAHERFFLLRPSHALTPAEGVSSVVGAASSSHAALRSKMKRSPKAGFIAWNFLDGTMRVGEATSIEKLAGTANTSSPGTVAQTSSASKHTRVYLNMHDGLVRCAAFPEIDVGLLVTGGSDCNVQVWKRSDQAVDSDYTLQATLHGHRAPVTALAVSKAFCLIASASLDSTVILWDLYTSRAVRQLRLLPAGSKIHSVAINNRSGYIAIASNHPTMVMVCDLNGELMAQYPELSGSQHSIHSSPLDAISSLHMIDSACYQMPQSALLFLTGHVGGSIRVWNLVYATCESLSHATSTNASTGVHGHTRGKSATSASSSSTPAAPIPKKSHSASTSPASTPRAPTIISGSASTPVPRRTLAQGSHLAPTVELEEGDEEDGEDELACSPPALSPMVSLDVPSGEPLDSDQPSPIARVEEDELGSVRAAGGGGGGSGSGGSGTPNTPSSSQKRGDRGEDPTSSSQLQMQGSWDAEDAEAAAAQQDITKPSPMALIRKVRSSPATQTSEATPSTPQTLSSSAVLPSSLVPPQTPQSSDSSSAPLLSESNETGGRSWHLIVAAELVGHVSAVSALFVPSDRHSIWSGDVAGHAIHWTRPADATSSAATMAANRTAAGASSTPLVPQVAPNVACNCKQSAAHKSLNLPYHCRLCPQCPSGVWVCSYCRLDHLRREHPYDQRHSIVKPGSIGSMSISRPTTPKISEQIPAASSF